MFKMYQRVETVLGSGIITDYSAIWNQYIVKMNGSTVADWFSPDEIFAI